VGEKIERGERAGRETIVKYLNMSIV